MLFLLAASMSAKKIQVMNRLMLIAAACLICLSCQNQDNWKQVAVIEMKTVAPIGLSIFDDQIWISDGDNNRLMVLDLEGELRNEIVGFERPMHIEQHAGVVYVPEYGIDQVTLLKDGGRSALQLKEKLDAPAAVSVFGNELAIADFYNHQVLYFNGQDWMNIGQKGKDAGEFHYPTDVQIMANELYVADAYNNRVQVFSKDGSLQRIIGEAEKMNAATGIHVSETSLFVTDFENDRLLVYDLQGSLKQTITENLDKPTDAYLYEGKLYITNYQGKNLLVMKK